MQIRFDFVFWTFHAVVFRLGSLFLLIMHVVVLKMENSVLYN